MSWSKEQVTLLVDEYKRYPCLYFVKSKDYKNKHARTRALEAIVQVVSSVRPSVTTAEIKSKFHGLKTNFLTEHRKYEQSLKSGTGEDDVYHPTIWYYDQMFFILDHSTPRKGVDSIGIDPQDTADADAENFNLSQYDHESDAQDDSQYMGNEDEEFESFEVQSDYSLKRIPTTSNAPIVKPQATSSHSGTPSPSGSGTTPYRKRKQSDRPDKMIEDATDAIKVISTVLKEKNRKAQIQTVEKHPHDIFAEFVASKMKQMDPEVANEVEEKITTLLFKGIRESKKIQHNL